MTTVRVDVRQVTALADRLARVPGRTLGIVARDVVNEVTVQFERQAIDGGVANINLSKTYVRDKTDVTLATSLTKPRSVIETAGDLTPLGRFGPVRARSPGAPRRAGPIKGNRSAGVFVNVTNDDRLFEPQWFLLPLKNNPGLFGVFVRDDALPPRAGASREGQAGKRHIYGPSPYQLFRQQIKLQGTRWVQDLEDTATTRLLTEIERVVR